MAGNDANLNAGAAPPEVEPPLGGGVGNWGPQTWALQPQMQPMYQQVLPRFATPPDPMMTFMQMMNIQMQQFMQGMQQQMQQQTAAQPAPIHSNGALLHRRLDRFSNKNDDWKEWRLHFMTVI